MLFPQDDDGMVMLKPPMVSITYHGKTIAIPAGVALPGPTNTIDADLLSEPSSYRGELLYILYIPGFNIVCQAQNLLVCLLIRQPCISVLFSNLSF